MAQVQGEGDGPSYGGPNNGGGWLAQSGPYGVWGDSHSGYGVLGTSDYTGIFGYASEGGTGVVGVSEQDIGVWGIGANEGVWGIATGYGFGVRGLGDNAGVAAFNSHNENAAYLASDCCAAWFTGQVVINGDFSVAGRKSAIVKHPDGAYRKLYSMESPESWFEDIGAGRLHDGQASVRLDPDFAALVHPDSYHVFLTPYGDSNGLYVAERRPDGFTVREHQGGKHTIEFAYRVVAKRRDVPVVRLEPVQLPTKPSQPKEPRTRMPFKRPSIQK